MGAQRDGAVGTNGPPWNRRYAAVNAASLPEARDGNERDLAACWRAWSVSPGPERAGASAMLLGMLERLALVVITLAWAVACATVANDDDGAAPTRTVTKEAAREALVAVYVSRGKLEELLPDRIVIPAHAVSDEEYRRIARLGVEAQGHRFDHDEALSSLLRSIQRVGPGSNADPTEALTAARDNLEAYELSGRSLVAWSTRNRAEAEEVRLLALTYTYSNEEYAALRQRFAAYDAEWNVWEQLFEESVDAVEQYLRGLALLP